MTINILHLFIWFIYGLGKWIFGNQQNRMTLDEKNVALYDYYYIKVITECIYKFNSEIGLFESVHMYILNGVLSRF